MRTPAVGLVLVTVVACGQTKPGAAVDSSPGGGDSPTHLDGAAIDAPSGSHDGPPGAHSIERVFGNGIAVATFRPLNALPMRVLVKDSGGHPVAGDQVTWAFSPGELDLVEMPGLQPQQTVTQLTDASGYSTVYVWGSLLAQPMEESTVTATLTATGDRVAFLVTIVDGSLTQTPQIEFPDPVPYSTISGSVGQTLTAAFTATAYCNGTRCAGMPRIKDVSARIISADDVANVATGVPSSPYARCTPIEQLSGANGQMQCDLQLLAPFSGNLAVLSGLGSYMIYDVEITP